MRLEVVEVHLPVARHQRGARRHVLSPPRTVEAGQRLALEVLQAGAAAGRDVAERVLGEAERADGGGRVAAADDGRAPSTVASMRLGDRRGCRRRTARARRRPSGRSRTRCVASASFARTARRVARPDVEARAGRPGSRRRRRRRARRRRRTRSRPRRRPAARSRRRLPRPARGSRGRCRAGRPRAGSCRPRGPAPRGR